MGKNLYRMRGSEIRFADKGAISSNLVTGDPDQWVVPADTEYLITEHTILVDSAITNIPATNSAFFLYVDSTTKPHTIGSLLEFSGKASETKDITINGNAMSWAKYKYPVPLRLTAAQTYGWGGDHTSDTFDLTGADTLIWAVGIKGCSYDDDYREYVLDSERKARKRGTEFVAYVDASGETGSTDIISASDLASYNYVTNQLLFTVVSTSTTVNITIDFGGSAILTIPTTEELAVMSDEIYTNTINSVVYNTYVMNLDPVIISDSTADTLEITEVGASAVTVCAKGWKVARTQW